MKSVVGQDIIARSFTVGTGELTRVTQGGVLAVEVTFNALPDEVSLCVETRIGERVHAQPQPMTAVDGHYRTTLRCDHAGVVRFKVRYRALGKWHWDHVPYCYVMVDPSHLDRVRMYTLVPIASGKIRDWAARLPEIASMGFNMLHLLPITRMGASESPYAAYDLFTIDPRFLDPEDGRDGHAQFGDFITALKQHGIGLCVDLVLNHIGVDSKITETHGGDWLAEDPHEQDGIKRAGWQGADVFHRWEDLALLNYEPFDSRAGSRLWATMLRYAQYWAGFAAETGGVLRLDNLHSSHRQFVTWAMRRIFSRYPALIVLGEVFTDEASIRRLTRDVGLHLILATQWEHKFVPELRSYLSYLHRTARRVRHYFPISSHDSGVPAKEYGDVRSTAPRLVVSALLGPGPTGIVQGVERGVLEQIRFIGGPSEVMLSRDVDFRPLIRSLFQLVDAHVALRVAGNLAFFDAGHHAILAAARHDPNTQLAEVLVCVNLDIHAAQTLECDLTSVAPEGTRYRDATSGETLRSGRVSITLDAGTHRVYIRTASPSGQPPSAPDTDASATL